MTTYYVRKTGSDSNDGTNPDTEAWLTIDNAANNVSAGDTVYVGAGVYRELVTMDTSGSYGSQIEFIADVDGEKTGDAGLVMISAYNNDASSAVRATSVTINGRAFITIRGFCLMGGQTAALSGSGSSHNYEGIIIEDCVIMSGHAAGDMSINIDMNVATTPTYDGLIIRRCLIHGCGIYIAVDGNASAEQNIKVQIDSCVLIGQTSSNQVHQGIDHRELTSDTYSAGGIDVTNCTLIGWRYAVYVYHGCSTTYPVNIRNCYIKSDQGLYKATSDDGALTSDYNRLNCQTDYTNVTSGANDKIDTDVGDQLMGGLGDHTLYTFLGWSPFRPWEPIRTQDDGYQNHLIGTASASDAPAFDLYNEDRPMHSTSDDVGAVEGRARGERETTTVLSGDNALRFDGAGFHDQLLYVNSGITTVGVAARYDSSYTGTNPQLQVLNIPGVTDQTETMVYSSDMWEILSTSFEPTSPGIARIRLKSNDTSASGKCFFDEVHVSGEYYKKVLNIDPEHLLAYWPLWDTTGSTAEQIASTDIPAATWSQQTLADAIGPDGQFYVPTVRTGPGTPYGYLNVYSTQFETTWDPNHFSLICWAKPSSSSVWEDGVTRYLWWLAPDPGYTYFQRMMKPTTGTIMQPYRYSGSNHFYNSHTPSTTSGWICWGWSVNVEKQYMRWYDNGRMFAQKGAGTMVDLPEDDLNTTYSSFFSRRNNNNETGCWDGWMAHIAIWNGVALTDAQHAQLAMI